MLEDYDAVRDATSPAFNITVLASMSRRAVIIARRLFVIPSHGRASRLRVHTDVLLGVDKAVQLQNDALKHPAPPWQPRSDT
ncbi:hypothetical protein AB0M47_29530 [Hamadaea sp. NPDC051192]|uniref:hypothetical protein n=1 Tax=Hamadaea sp. NPDC051192 TaxID=3154940 RepID=UPI00341718A5